MINSGPGILSIFREEQDRQVALVSFDGSGFATACNGHVDLGTGIETALAQIVAEELDLPLDRIRMVLGDTQQTPDQGPTIASETIQVAAVPLRQAAAQLRQELRLRAAKRLGVAVTEISTRQGKVCLGDQALPYVDLLPEGNVGLRLDPTTPVKDPASYRIVGRKAGRRDLASKVTGEHRFIQDVELPGMVHGHVIRPPYAGRDSGSFIGHSLLSYDAASVSGLPGFIDIVQEADFLAVVAERADQAANIAQRLQVNWQAPPPDPFTDSEPTSIADSIRRQPSSARVLQETGLASEAHAEADRVLRRSYIWPYHLHGSIGPSCALANWNDGQPVVWSGTQNPHMLRDDLATLVALDKNLIEVRRYQAAGCYGRNCADDVSADALLIARAVGRPVKVQLTRSQESLWEPRGAAQVMDVIGGLKAKEFYSYQIDSWYPSNRGPNLALLLTRRISAEPRPSDMGDRTLIPPYRIPHKRITVHDLAPIVRAAWLRGVSALPNTFAHECFIDELAYTAQEDPLAFRLRHLDDPRMIGLVQQTAEQAGWQARSQPRQRRQGRMAYGQGFAVASYVHGTFPGTAAASAAWVCDVQVNLDSGEVSLTRVFVGQDQGLVINPDGVRQQIHGNVIQTASRTLTEAVSMQDIRRTPADWASYPIQTFPELPQIETLLVERPGDPALGVGESAAVPAAAAIANAIFDATGVRICAAPFTPERVRAALEKESLGALDRQAPRKRLASIAPASALNWLGQAVKRWAAALGALLTIGAIALPLQRAIPATTSPPASSFSQALLAQGKQVFAAGNCASCHTQAGGIANAGGRAFATPFGTLYSTNLTPDPETGLGRWSYSAFERAMRQGISRNGQQLYPAFPYTAFAKLTAEDMYALYGYLQTLEPVKQVTPQAQMFAPMALRPALAVWNLMFHDARPLPAAPQQDPAWKRGRYLVESAGHCGACHTPRNLLGAEQRANHLEGAMVNGWYAPALIGTAAGARGWDEQSLYDYLRTGVAPALAAASGPMAEVIGNLADLPDTDIRAMATYLSSQVNPTQDTFVPPPEVMPLPTATSRLFDMACATCHLPAVSSLATAAQIPLGQSSAVRAPNLNAIRTIIREGSQTPFSSASRDMPAFADSLTEQQIDALALYVRARFAADL